jgi:hypothetical protein
MICWGVLVECCCVTGVSPVAFGRHRDCPFQDCTTTPRDSTDWTPQNGEVRNGVMRLVQHQYPILGNKKKVHQFVLLSMAEFVHWWRTERVEFDTWFFFKGKLCLLTLVARKDAVSIEGLPCRQ